MNLVMIEGPQAEPVALEEAKLHLRVDGNEDDLLISSLITSAREYCETWQARAYVSQIWELVLDRFPKDKNHITLPLPPLQSVESLKYKDKDGAETIWDTSNYIIDTASQPGRLVLAYDRNWPSVVLQPANAITIRFRAGYGNAEDVPERLKAAIKLLVGNLYEHREELMERELTGKKLSKASMTVQTLLWLDRIISF